MANWKKSQFNLELPVNSNLLIFNTWSGKIILFDEYEGSTWNVNPELMEPNTVQYLQKNKFLTKETDEFKAFSNSLKPNHPHFVYYKIFTTTDCNARCWYCFEQSFDKKYMSVETADHVVDYIVNNIGSYDSIKLDWFGGEPLLNWKIISYIVDSIKTRLPKIRITSGMITNGALFNENMITEAVTKWNLKHVQITLDGCKKLYESTKNYIDSSLSFEKVLNNVQLLCESGINVSIRVNFNSSTYVDCCNLIDYLYYRFGHNVHIYGAPIFDTDSNVHFDVDKNAEDEIFDRLLMYKYVKIKRMLNKRSVSCSLSYYEDFLVIDPSGDLYKCAESMLCGSDNKIGNVLDSELDYRIIEKWKHHVLRMECKTCPYFPLCLGGCAANQLGITNIQCFRFKSQIPKIIKILFDDYKNTNSELNRSKPDFDRMT